MVRKSAALPELASIRLPPAATLKVPPVAEEARRFRGSIPIGGHGSDRESDDTTGGALAAGPCPALLARNGK